MDIPVLGEAIDGLMKKQDDSQISVVARKPNPRNVDNLAKVEECEANLKKYV